MAKIVWLNPIFTGGTSLDLSINSHDVDRIAQTELLTKQGHEVWLHDVAVSKRRFSSYPFRINSEELEQFDADIAILTVGEFAWDYLAFRYFEEAKDNGSRARGVNSVVKWLDKFNGKIYASLFDPRPSFQKVFVNPRGKHPLYDHLNRATMIVADTDFLDDSLKERAVVSEYWKAVKTSAPRSFSNREDYFCVIPMMKRQTTKRKNMLKEWYDVPNCWTAGPVNVSGVESLTNYKMVDLNWVLDATERSTTSLVFGEPTHTWLTPRVIQSMTTGTICSIHPSFRGSQVFSEEIRSEQTFETASQFNRDLLSEEVYQRQLDFVEELRAGAHLTGIDS